MAIFTAQLPAMRAPAQRRRATALAPGQWLTATRGVDDARAAHTIALTVPATGEALGHLTGSVRARVLRAMAEDGDVAVRVRRVEATGRLWWRAVTVELDVLTAGDARAAQPASAGPEALSA